jgi:hypothetical protein
VSPAALPSSRNLPRLPQEYQTQLDSQLQPIYDRNSWTWWIALLIELGTTVRNLYNFIRSYLGGLALVAGFVGLSLFAFGIPISLFAAHFWGGFGFREGPQPSPEQLAAAISREFWWCVWHRLVPLFLLSATLLAYGFYEAAKERENQTYGT